MKYIFPLFISLLFIACADKHTAERLQQADSLMVSRPDSAFAILKSINRDNIKGDEQNAYYALLYTKAQYKNYASIESDSLIDVAVDYYSESDDNKKYAQSMLYKGSVLVDIGLSRTALDWFKMAEIATDSTDYLTLGLINTRLGELYQSTFEPNYEHIGKHKRALHYYRLANHKSFEIYAISTIGRLYIGKNNDSAYHYLNLAITLDKKYNEDRNLLCDLSWLATLYNFDHKYDEAKNTALLVLNNGGTINSGKTPYTVLSMAYAKLGLVDSAKYYASLYTPLTTAVDTVNYYMMLEQIAVAENDYNNAYQYVNIATNIADSIVKQGRKQYLYNLEKQFDTQNANAKAKQLQSQIVTRNFIIIIAFLTVIILVMAIVLMRKRKRVLNEEQCKFIEQLQMDLKLQQVNTQSVLAQNLAVISSLNQTIEERAEIEHSLKALIEDRMTIMRKLMALKYELHDSPEQFIHKFSTAISIGEQSKSDCDKIVNIANKLNFNIITHLLQTYSELNDRDALLLSLICLKFTPIEICVFLNTSTINAVYVLRSRLGVKLNTKSIENFIDETLMQLKCN